METIEEEYVCGKMKVDVDFFVMTTYDNYKKLRLLLNGMIHCWTEGQNGMYTRFALKQIR